MSEPIDPRSTLFGVLAADLSSERRTALHALHVLEYALTAPALREQIEPDPTIEIDSAGIRDRLSTITRQFRQHQARQADLVYEAAGVELDDQP